MGWQRDMWNYHPSLPIKNMHMIEDITEMHGNMLLWSCLGSSAIGLPYLALEAEGAVEPRMRLHGYMNDREFCGECRKRGNTAVCSALEGTAMGIFAAEWNEDETQPLALNIHRDAGVKKRIRGYERIVRQPLSLCISSYRAIFSAGALLISKEIKLGITFEEFKAVSWKAGISWHDG